MATQENSVSTEMNFAPDEIRRLRVALVNYMEKALNGGVDGQISPAAIELLQSFLRGQASPVPPCITYEFKIRELAPETLDTLRRIRVARA